MCNVLVYQYKHVLYVVASRLCIVSIAVGTKHMVQHGKLPCCTIQYKFLILLVLCYT